MPMHFELTKHDRRLEVVRELRDELRLDRWLLIQQTQIVLQF